MHPQVSTKEFLFVMLLEAAQNAPLIGGFVAAFVLWHRNLPIAIACIVIGSILSALTMIPTEGKIFKGHHESIQAIITNIVVFSILMLAVVVYMQTSWSNWWTDIAGGLVVGAILGTTQDLAARERIGIVRNLALGVSCFVSLLVIRFVIKTWSPLVSFTVITVWFTLAMGGYKLWRRWVSPPPRESEKYNGTTAR